MHDILNEQTKQMCLFQQHIVSKIQRRWFQRMAHEQTARTRGIWGKDHADFDNDNVFFVARWMCIKL